MKNALHSAFAAITILAQTCSTATANTSTASRTDAPNRSRFEESINALADYKCDKAIRELTALLLSESKQTKGHVTKKYKACLFMWIGRGFQFDENDRAAAQCFRIADLLDPSNLVNKAYLVNALDRCAQHEIAAPLYKELEAAPARGSEIFEVLAQREMRNSNPARAEKLLSEALKLPAEADNAHLLIMKGRALIKLGLSKEGLVFYKRAAATSNSRYLAKIYELASIERQDDERRLALLKEAGEILPEDPMWRLDKADYYNAAAKPVLAEQDYLGTMQASRLYTKAFLESSEFFAGKKEQNKALSCIDEAIRLRPWAAELYAQKAHILINAGQNELGQKCLEQSIAYNDRNSSAYMQLTDCYLRKNDANGARKILAQALEKCPNSVGLWRKTADVDRMSGSAEKAYNEYNHVLKVAGSNIPPEYSKPDALESFDNYNTLLKNELALTYAALGTAAYQHNDMKTALAHAKAFNRFKFLPELPGYLNWLHLRPGRIAEGETKIETEYNNAIFLGDMLRETRQFNDCVREYEKAVAINDNSADLHSYLMDAMSEKNDWVGYMREDIALSNKLMAKIPKEFKRMTDSTKKTGYTFTR